LGQCGWYANELSKSEVDQDLTLSTAGVPDIETLAVSATQMFTSPPTRSRLDLRGWREA